MSVGKIDETIEFPIGDVLIRGREAIKYNEAAFNLDD